MLTLSSTRFDANRALHSSCVWCVDAIVMQCPEDVVTAAVEHVNASLTPRALTAAMALVQQRISAL